MERKAPDVAVDDVVAVRVVERIGHFGRDLDGFFDAELCFPIELFPHNVGHHVIQESVGLTRVEQRQDVGMLRRFAVVLISCTNRSAPSTAASSGLKT